MSDAKITLIGFYNYFNNNNQDLFQFLTLPEGIDKETVVNNILLRGGEFEVLYSDPYFTRNSIDIWSKKWNWTFKKWFEAINIKYCPLENYNRIEDGTLSQKDSGNNSSNSSGSINNNSGFNSTRTDNLGFSSTRTDNLKSQTESSANNTSENKTSAYDSSDYSPHDLTSYDGTTEETTNNTGTQIFKNTNTGTQNIVNSSTDNTTQNGSVSSTSEMTTDKVHNLRIHGNIGVTTSQQMLQSELDIALFNLYDKISDIFLQEYVIPVY